jgi:hypothetical protein
MIGYSGRYRFSRSIAGNASLVCACFLGFYGHRDFRRNKKGDGVTYLGLIYFTKIIINMSSNNNIDNPVEEKVVDDGEAELQIVPTNTPPYTIYTKRQKIGIIFAASFASFFSPMSANIYVPALNSVAASMHVSNSKINLTLTTYLVRLSPPPI